MKPILVVLMFLSAASWAQDGAYPPLGGIPQAMQAQEQLNQNARAQAANLALLRQQTKLLKQQTELLKKQNAAAKKQLLAGIPISAPAQHKIMIFGGDDHKVYLGCLSCSEFATDSVRNSFGPSGSAFVSASIFNVYGEYGGAYSDNSPCNRYATHPPVIVDESGGYYGELTINEYESERTHSEIVNTWIAGVCQGKR